MNTPMIAFICLLLTSGLPRQGLTQQVVKKQTFKLARTVSLENRLAINSQKKGKLKTAILFERRSSRGFGNWIDDPQMVWNNGPIRFALGFSHDILYFNENGKLLLEKSYPRPDVLIKASENGQFLLVWNFEKRTCRLERFDGASFWEEDLRKYARNGIPVDRMIILPNGHTFFGFDSCNDSDCKNEKMVIYDTAGNVREIGALTAGAFFYSVFAVSRSGKYCALNGITIDKKNLVALYDLESGTEIWRHTSKSRFPYSHFVTDEGYVIASSGVHADDASQNLCFFNPNGQIVKNYPGKRVPALISPDEAYIIEYGKSASIFAVRSGKLLTTLPENFIPEQLTESLVIGLSGNKVASLTLTGELSFYENDLAKGHKTLFGNTNHLMILNQHQKDVTFIERRQ